MKKMFLLFLSVFALSCSSDAVQEKPNIVFIFADDQCYDAVAALGINDEVITPNLDRLVDNGTTFTHAFNMGAWSGAVCVASRAMINTGRFVWNAHSVDNKTAMVELCEEGKLWAPMMKSAGYDTYMTGKWHVKAPSKKVFNQVVHERHGMPSQTTEGYNRPTSKNDTIWQPWKTEFGGFWEGGKHWSEVLGDDALAFIDQAKANENPFFCI